MAGVQDNLSPDVSYGLHEYLVLSGGTKRGIGPDTISLGCKLRDGLFMPLGWFSAAMQTVSGYELGIALAQYGGCATLPASLPVEQQVQLGRDIKRAKAGFNRNVLTVRPYDRIATVMEHGKTFGYSSFPVVDDGGVLVGLITKKNYHPGNDAALSVSDRMIRREESLVYARKGISLTQANEQLLTNGIGILPVVDDQDRFESAVFWSDIDKAVRFRNEFVDENGSYRFAGAVSTHERDRTRARALVDAGCDILVVDSSQAKGDYGRAMVSWLRDEYPDKPIMAGNIIDEQGFLDLANAGADVVKIGQGPGYACSTRNVKRTGWGQGTAFKAVRHARDRYAQEPKGRSVLLCGDGGIDNSGLMIVAYAFGMDFLMMGSYFARFRESAAQVTEREVDAVVESKPMRVWTRLKEYAGEASSKILNVARYNQEDKRLFVPEGVVTLVPERGSVHDPENGIELDIAFVKKAFSESGARNPQEFAANAVLELQSAGSQEEGRPK